MHTQSYSDICVVLKGLGVNKIFQAIIRLPGSTRNISSGTEM